MSWHISVLNSADGTAGKADRSSGEGDLGRWRVESRQQLEGMSSVWISQKYIWSHPVEMSKRLFLVSEN